MVNFVDDSAVELLLMSFSGEYLYFHTSANSKDLALIFLYARHLMETRSLSHMGLATVLGSSSFISRQCEIELNNKRRSAVIRTNSCCARFMAIW